MKNTALCQRFTNAGWAFIAAATAAVTSMGCGSNDTPSRDGVGVAGATGQAAGSSGQPEGRAGAPGIAGAPVLSSGGASSILAGSGGYETSAGGLTGTGGTDGGLGGGGASASGGTTGAAGASGSPAVGGAGMGAGGSGGSYAGTKTPGTAQAGDVTINPAQAYQTMDGFGIADVWQSKSNSTAAMLTLLFDPVNGIGLSLLRVGIDGTSGKPNIMGDAAFLDGPAVVKYGGKVWAAPWSPPASSKDNGNVNNGGHLNTAAYDSWASVLAAFPAYYKQQSGVDLYAVSAQNEPDFVASYQSCIYDKTQMNNFIKVLAPKLAALNPPVRVLAAEPDVWTNLWSGDNYGTAMLGDASVNPLVTIIATHDYGSNVSSTTRPSQPAGNTHHVWETEATYTNGASIGAGLDIARGIYAAVTSGGVNGWHYWWTQSFMDGGTAAAPPKRVYAMGNFSKFVRPGYVRVGVTGAPSSVQIVPFTSPADGTVAIVALNSGTSAQQVSFFVAGSAWPGTVAPYVTSSSANLTGGAPVTVSGGRFIGSLPAQSVTTFVGKP